MKKIILSTVFLILLMLPIFVNAAIVCQYESNNVGKLKITVNDNKVTISGAEKCKKDGDSAPRITSYLNVSDFSGNKCPDIYTIHSTRGEVACAISASYIAQSEKTSGTLVEHGHSGKIPETTTIPDNLNCLILLGDPEDSATPSPAFLLTYAFKIIRYVAIILLIVLSIMDFATATASSDPDELNNAVKKTVTRLILCVAIFLLPYLLEFVLSIINKGQANVCIGI